MDIVTDANIFLAFGAGLLSFVSPCVLPLFPAFLSYITGMSVSEVQDENKKLTKRSLTHTILFLLGFSVIFIALGFASTKFGTFLKLNEDLIRQVGAILIIFLGLVITGILNIKFLMKNKQITFKNRPAGYFGSFVIGLAFSMGWTPCMGPILLFVLSLASTQPDKGIILMISYVLGFAIPFLVLSLFIGKLNIIKKYSNLFMKIGGYMMILVGVVLYFDGMTKLTSFLSEITGFSGF